MKKVFFFAFILVSLFVWSACSRNEQGTSTGQRPEIGSVAPDFTLKDLRGRDVRLSSYRGHVVLVDFWATWCPPCKATIPELISVEERYGDRGVIVLGVSIDEGPDVGAKLSAFSREYNMNYPVLIGSDAVEDSYDITSIPTMLLLDKKGNIRDLYRGYRENFQNIVSAEIDKLL